MTSKYRQAKALSQIKIGRLRAQRPSLTGPHKPSATCLNAGIWRSFGDGPGGNSPPRPGYQLGKAVAQKRITLARISILEDDRCRRNPRLKPD